VRASSRATRARGRAGDGALPRAPPADGDEFARTIVFLASDDAVFVNGAILAVDGGRTAI
jgi:NAD(P)-dependent dehydrogenase (short-subunit alcohol dehydrogenase family)